MNRELARTPATCYAPKRHTAGSPTFPTEMSARAGLGA